MIEILNSGFDILDAVWDWLSGNSLFSGIFAIAVILIVAGSILGIFMKKGG